ncbi:MAG: amidohydrolase [Candidatus Doudnabacteria bacterium RIFCSPLOWO2_02_FULL_48_13]|uniref:Amidohydrolase n=1 Tax=Candidatus Doudnabacteria bacterium RIFCSPLOWO2_02_FULL_48_13 TaxID=1817845 RepID=A0A1F5Q8M6_9BACT|nr:MAG: amidohydrolase [Candidatus Doudnabacteria bacterium RIFCSPHIGHO2_01_FULL_48_180]OGE98551.1 MAG: amidohydrolase [Candidatus Doudnabacteria bacterium RIFCSPLOWO2_02_FULL_48_13]OGF01834.1 MAG: amidohydrolase [Candidatus Doudnabacteria bacterium RIFCSPLOWO2_12_FULL_47_12]
MILQGKIVNFDSQTEGQVLINEQTGLIEQVGQNLGSADLKTEGFIFPGFIDVHVHVREDVSGKELYKEGLKTASDAAINGGVTHLVDMPNNPVPPIDDASYAEKKKIFKNSLVDVTLYAGVGQNTEPLSTPVPYKVFLAKPPVGALFFQSEAAVEEVMARYCGQYLSFHAEDAEILDAHKGAPAHEQQRPPEAETKAIETVIELAEKFDLRAKICHLSTAAGLEKIKAAKKRGINMTCEVTPHHLYFDESHLTQENRKWLQMNPPLRSKEDRAAMLEGLKSGDIDFLATDHAPHTLEEKIRGTSGLPHLDTYGPFITWLMKEQGFSASQIARVCGGNPGEFVNQFTEEKFGAIKPGFVGSLTIVNPDEPLTVSKEILKTKCAWSPFEGVTFPGRVTHTIIRGKVYQI